MIEGGLDEESEKLKGGHSSKNNSGNNQAAHSVKSDQDVDNDFDDFLDRKANNTSENKVVV